MANVRGACDRLAMQPLILTRPESHDGGAARVLLAVAGYQFSGPHRFDSDANWLLVDLTVEHEGRGFARRDPCLETRDLERIAAFFDKCANATEVFASWGRPRLRSVLSFTEPNLQLEVHSGPPFTLRVHLAAECVPPFAQDLDHTPTYDEDENVVGASAVWLDFPTSAADLRAAADIVRTWAEAFPRRHR
jgi:hypothetical protein